MIAKIKLILCINILIFLFVFPVTASAIEIDNIGGMDASVTFDSADDYEQNVVFDNKCNFDVISTASSWQLDVKSNVSTIAGLNVDEVLRARVTSYNNTGWNFLSTSSTTLATGNSTDSNGCLVTVEYEINWSQHGLIDKGWDDFTTGNHFITVTYTLTEI